MVSSLFMKVVPKSRSPELIEKGFKNKQTFKYFKPASMVSLVCGWTRTDLSEGLGLASANGKKIQ